MQNEELIVKAITIISESMRESIRKYKEETPNGKELFNLSITQLHYLHAIREQTHPTITELAEIFGVQKSTATVAVNKLLERGLIEKFSSENDLRVVYARLSEKGQELIATEESGYHQFAGRIMETLDAEERKTFAVLLNKVVNNITRS